MNNYGDHHDFNDLTIILLSNGEYLVKTQPMSNDYFRVSNKEEVKNLILETRDLTKCALYIGLDRMEIIEFNNYCEEVLEMRYRLNR